jgi:hypothetical protein
VVNQTKLKHKIKPAIIYSALSFLILFGWAVGSPPGSSPDEDIHLSSTWCHAKYQEGNCETIPQRLVEVGKCYFLDSQKTSVCEKDIPQKEVVPERVYEDKKYYHFLSYFISLDSIDRSTIQLRFVNSILSSLSIFLIVLLTTRSIYLPILISWLIVNIPLGFFILSSVNPSSWLYIFAFIFLPFVYDLLRHNDSTTLVGSKILIVFVALIFALEGRLDTILFASVFSISLLPTIFNMTTRSKQFKIVVNVLTLAMALPLTIAVWDRSTLVNFREFKISEWENLASLPSILTGVFGGWGLGSLETTMPPVTYIGSFVTILVILFISLRFINKSESITYILLGFFAFSIPLFVLNRSNLRVGEWLQPRYILPIFYALIGLCLIIIFKSFKTKHLLLLINFLFIFSTITFSFALHTFYRRYTVGLDNYSLIFREPDSWWWKFNAFPSPILTYAVTVIVFIVFWLKIKREISAESRLVSPNNSEHIINFSQPF